MPANPATRKPVQAAFRRLTRIAVLAVLVTAGSVAASTIYKWTDADGNVHYTDTPAPDGRSERVSIESRPTDPQRIAALVQTRRDTRADATRARQQAADEADMTAEERKQAEADRAQKCTMYKERLQQFLQSRRLYREGENGERVYLSEEETQTARNKVQKQVEENCTD